MGNQMIYNLANFQIYIVASFLIKWKKLKFEKIRKNTKRLKNDTTLGPCIKFNFKDKIVTKV